ncbi:MAG: undecaprenyl diphosphate synthase family protein [Methermicoccaceae archaeon]
MRLFAPYEYLLKRKLLKDVNRLPGYITLILNEGELSGRGLKKLRDTVGWCNELNVNLLSVYIDLLPIENVSELSRQVAISLYNLFSFSPYKVELFKLCGKNNENVVSGVLAEPLSPIPPYVMLSVGVGGKRELTNAIHEVLKKVEQGIIEPDEIDEEEMENHLLFPHEPDLVIRSGGQRLADFLVWQSVYSELYFTDVNWHTFRKIDFLRAVRDFQRRQRRYGK